MEIFKVRNKEGLFWVGSGKNKFTTTGKQWNKIGHVALALKNHNRYFVKDETTGRYRTEVKLPAYLLECEIVKYELQETETIPMQL